MYQNIIFATLLGLSLIGCATHPISNSEAIPVPAKRIIDAKFIHRSPNSGEVTIKRDSGISGSACSTRIYVNANPIADIRTSEKVVLYLPEGEYILSAEPNGICGGGLTEVKVLVKPGSKLNFRYGTSGHGSPSIFPTAF